MILLGFYGIVKVKNQEINNYARAKEQKAL